MLIVVKPMRFSVMKGNRSLVVERTYVQTDSQLELLLARCFENSPHSCSNVFGSNIEMEDFQPEPCAYCLRNFPRSNEEDNFEDLAELLSSVWSQVDAVPRVFRTLEEWTSYHVMLGKIHFKLNRLKAGLDLVNEEGLSDEVSVEDIDQVYYPEDYFGKDWILGGPHDPLDIMSEIDSKPEMARWRTLQKALRVLYLDIAVKMAGSEFCPQAHGDEPH